MSMLWDDPDTVAEEDEYGSDDLMTVEDLIEFEETAREAAADSALWERPRGLNEWDADPEDDF